MSHTSFVHAPTIVKARPHIVHQLLGVFAGVSPCLLHCLLNIGTQGLYTAANFTPAVTECLGNLVHGLICAVNRKLIRRIQLIRNLLRHIAGSRSKAVPSAGIDLLQRIKHGIGNIFNLFSTQTGILVQRIKGIVHQLIHLFRHLLASRFNILCIQTELASHRLPAGLKVTRHRRNLALSRLLCVAGGFCHRLRGIDFANRRHTICSLGDHINHALNGGNNRIITLLEDVRESRHELSCIAKDLVILALENRTNASGCGSCSTTQLSARTLGTHTGTGCGTTSHFGQPSGSAPIAIRLSVSFAGITPSPFSR